MIRRPPRSTLSSSSAASDVYKRQEGDLTLVGRAYVRHPGREAGPPLVGAPASDLRRRAGQQDDELVPAVPRNHVTGADARGELTGSRDQHLVAHPVAE